MVVSVDESVLVYDTHTDESYELLTAPAIREIVLSTNGDYLLVEQENMDSEIWLLRFEDVVKP